MLSDFDPDMTLIINKKPELPDEPNVTEVINELKKPAKDYKEYVTLLITRTGMVDLRATGNTQVLLIQKDRPAWQAGKLNLPGGKVEDGESLEEAAIRELKEETGLHAIIHRGSYGAIIDRGLIIHCLHGVATHPYSGLFPRYGETEVPIWMELSEAFVDPRLIPNLRVVIPLLKCGVSDWIITDNAAVEQGEEHSFSLTVPTYIKPSEMPKLE